MASRVWIYQSNRPFAEKEQELIENQLVSFVKEWSSHSRQLAASGEILHNRFVVLSVDESLAGASGCSVDSSVRFLKELEQTFQINLFDRFIFSYMNQNEVRSVDSGTFAALYKNGEINDETLVFDTLINTKQDLETGFLKPLKESWHRRML